MLKFLFVLLLAAVILVIVALFASAWLVSRIPWRKAWIAVTNEIVTPVRPSLAARKARNDSRLVERAEAELRRTDPLRALSIDLARLRTERRLVLDEMTARLDNQETPGADKSQNALDRSQFVFAAADCWRGHEFTERLVADDSLLDRVGVELDPRRWSFRSTPTPSRAVVSAQSPRLVMSSDDKLAISDMRTDAIGRLAFICARIASQIVTRRSWKLDFFDTYGIRVDLLAEVKAVSTRAANMRHLSQVVGPEPTGALRNDTQIVETYCEKTLLIEHQIDALLERLRAFADYDSHVAQVEIGMQKQEWLERVSEVGGFEHDLATVDDSAGAERIRMAATESAMLADVYLEVIRPQVAALEVTGDL